MIWKISRRQTAFRAKARSIIIVMTKTSLSYIRRGLLFAKFDKLRIFLSTVHYLVNRLIDIVSV